VIGNMDEDTPKAFNLYRNKKLLSHGMMDVALFSANANQLRYVLENSDGSVLYVICVVLLLVSIFLQVIIRIVNFRFAIIILSLAVLDFSWRSAFTERSVQRD